MPTTRPKAAPCRKAGTIRSRTRLWRWTAPTRATRLAALCGDLGDDAGPGRAAESEPESRTGLRPRTLQASERGRAAVPKTQGLPAHPHAVRQARYDVSGLPAFRCRRRNDMRFSINRPQLPFAKCPPSPAINRTQSADFIRILHRARLESQAWAANRHPVLPVRKFAHSSLPAGVLPCPSSIPWDKSRIGCSVPA